MRPVGDIEGLILNLFIINKKSSPNDHKIYSNFGSLKTNSLGVIPVIFLNTLENICILEKPTIDDISVNVLLVLIISSFAFLIRTKLRYLCIGMPI